MHILFLDESGTPPSSPEAGVRYFVLGGIIVPEESWHSLRDSLLGMKIRRKIRGELKWRYFSPHNNEPRNPMRALDQAERDDIRKEIYAIVAADKSLKSLAAVVSIPAAFLMPSVNDQEGVYQLAYKVLTERFQYYLQDITKETDRDAFGLIIADHRGRDNDKRLRAHHQMLVHSSAAFTSKYGNLIESVLLQPSNLSIGIQIADMISGAVWRRFERDDGRFYEMMEGSLRRSRAGVVDGYGIVRVPKATWV